METIYSEPLCKAKLLCARMIYDYFAQPNYAEQHIMHGSAHIIIA